MKKFLLLLTIIFISGSLYAQNPWSYTYKISFPVEDSVAAQPYLCTLDDDGRLWVISSKATTLQAHNAVYFADYGDTVFTKWIDYDLNGDSDTLSGNIGALRGITFVGNDMVLSASQPYPKTKPNTLSAMYYYYDADTNQVEQYGWGLPQGAGYGSFNHGIDATSDSIVYAGISFGSTFRCFNYSLGYTASAVGSWIPPFPDNPTIYSNTMEPGGPETSGIDLIRDISLVPGGDYNEANTQFYTSRNSLSNTDITGGIAVWSGGVQTLPGDYAPERVVDFDGFLSFIDPIPYGIDVDTNGILWVAGIDSTRRWVKGFQLLGINAAAMYELPGQNSMSIPDPNGAPMTGPCDVALNHNAGVAYVIDAYTRSAYVFENSLVSVEDNESVVREFALDQNFPNPFNPSTMIRFHLPQSEKVSLYVSNVLGNRVATLVDDVKGAGSHVVTFNAVDLSSGIYFYTIVAGNKSITKKMLFVK